MKFPVIFNVIGMVILIMSAFMLFPLNISFYSHGPDFNAFLLSFAISALSAAVILFSTRKHRKEELHHREGFIIVTASWLAISLFGCLPYYLTDYFSSFTNAPVLLYICQIPVR